MLNSEFRQDQYLSGFNLYATSYSYLSNFLYSKMIENNATNCTTSQILYNTTNYTMNLTDSFSQDFFKNLTSCNSYFNGTNTTTIYVTNGYINIQVKKILYYLFLHFKNLNLIRLLILVSVEQRHLVLLILKIIFIMFL